MTAPNSLSTFHLWLLAQSTGHAPVRTIVLHGDPSVFGEQLIEEVANYLNEYDDDGAGCWLAATSELVQVISKDDNLESLLGMAKSSRKRATPGAGGFAKTLAALGGRGHVIFRNLIPPAKPLELPLAFHAGIGNPCGDASKCHLVLNPELMDPASLAHIIGDVFLEWLHRELHRFAPASRAS